MLILALITLGREAIIWDLIRLLIFLYVGSFLLSLDKWIGGIFGLGNGASLIAMGIRNSYQAFPLEVPLGILVIISYLLCGYYVYKKNKK